MSMAVTFLDGEIAYLRSQRLGRLATVDRSGAPQNNPVGFVIDEVAGHVVIGGLAMAKTRKFRNVQANPHVAFVVDDLASVSPWVVRGVEVRGMAEALVDVDRCHGVANLCVPYFAQGFAPATLVPLVDRSVYPEAEYPAGQWDYQLFYEESFDRARAAFEADVRGTVKALFRGGSPRGKGKPARTARVRRDGGWFGGLGARPRCRSTPSCSPRRISSGTRTL